MSSWPHALLLLALCCLPLSGWAQETAFFTTQTLDVCDFNVRRGTYSNCQSKPFVTTFSINPDESVIHHKTPTMSSDYFVNNKNVDNAKNQFMYEVISDAKNPYFFIFDITEQKITITSDGKPNDPDNKPFALVYSVKDMWTEKGNTSPGKGGAGSGSSSGSNTRRR